MKVIPVRWAMPEWRGWDARAGFVVRVDDGGAIGLGEATPLPGRSGESLDRCGAALARAAREIWPALPPSQLAARCDDVCAGAPAAAWAVWSALLDARARALGVSFASLLAAPSTRVPLSAVVGDPVAARAAVKRGIRTLKVKSTALADIAAVRDAVGFGVALRIDANRAAIDLAPLADLRIEYVEEPADRRPGAVRIPLALDETLAEPGEPSLDGVVALVLKPMVLGPARTLALAARARAAGLAAVLSHSLEGPVGLAAAAEVALALGTGAAGLDAHPGLGAWKVVVPTLGPATIDDVPRTGTGLDNARALERAHMLGAA